ncbi:MAG: hypothetical protein WC538_21075 [Thermoanaerobaculia bacterium]|jgi:hypothetical protein
MHLVPIVRLCDCPRGCIVVQFGCVLIHLDRASFIVLADEVARITHLLRAPVAMAEG